MVHRDRNAGALILDVRLGKLGRYKRASGTQDPKQLADIKRTICLLRDEHPPRYDVLAMLLRGELHPLDLHKAYIRGELNTLPTTDELKPLEDVVRAWVKTLDRAQRTIDDYEARLIDLVGTLNDLPAIMTAKRAKALVSGKRRSFNLDLVAARMLLKGVVGTRHRLFEALERVEGLRVVSREGNPQTREQIAKLAADLGKHGSNAWSIALSGMRRNEYFPRHWKLLPDRLQITGSKTTASRRLAPVIYPISQPTCKADTFNHLISEASDKQVTIHDLRYTYTRWLEDAGIPIVRIDWYTGHKVKSVSELYRRGRGFEEYLAKDADKIREWFGEPPASGLRVIAS